MKKSIINWLCALGFALLAPGLAHATLTVTPITFNVIGLDSNNPATGPRYFPVGARVCSTVAITNVNADFVWDSANPYIALRTGSLATLNFPSIGAGNCVDAYFEAEVQQVAAAFDTVRRYHIAASDGSISGSTPTPRELYVEHLVSQARNGVWDVLLNGVSVPPGGTMALLVGNTYDITLSGATATQGYNQLESFINFSNTIFQILAVNTTYSADTSPTVTSPNDRLYADACTWDANPLSANYNTCVGGDGKAGGTVVTTYKVRIISGGGTSTTLTSLVYDFSGSSFHYNADYAVSGRVAAIVDPTTLSIAKSFTPSPTVAGGTSVLTFNIGNPNAGAVGGVSFSDNLPNLPAQMTVASPVSFATSGCGTPAFAPTAGATSLTFANGTVAANGICTVSVRVSVPLLPTTGTYVNTSGNLFAGTVNTGKTATANLDLATSAPPAGSCGLTLAQWTMGTGTGTAPPAYSIKAADVAQALASTNASNSSISTAIGNPANSWSTRPYNVAIGTNYVDFTVTTTNYTAVTFNFDAKGDASGPTSLQIYYSVDGGTTFSPWGVAQAISGATFTSYGGTLPVAANAAGDTVFRISATGAPNAGANANFFVDNVTVGGCQTTRPATIAKAFSPGPIAVGAGSISTLTFTVTNPNATALSGVIFADALPAGMQVAGVPAATNNCGGTWAPTAGATTLTLSAGTLAASSSCTTGVNVTLTTSGPHVNVSGFVSSTEGGTNSGATGSATAGLTGLLPPVLAKGFTPNPIPAGGVSVLTFVITNPNIGNALSGVAFADVYPAGLVNAALPVPNNSCGGLLTAVPTTGSMSLTGGSLAAGANCTIEIAVTAASAGAYANTSGAVSATTAGNGNTASATLTVNAPAPAISLDKKAGISPTGPWLSFLVVAPTTPVYYQFVVENTGDVTFATFGVSDPQLAGGAADPAGCAWQTSNLPSTLPTLPAASPTLDPVATCVRGPVPAVLGTVANTATAQGVYGGSSYTSAPAQATYLGALASFSLSKLVAASIAGPWASNITVAAGAPVYYQFTVSNTGALPVSGITINDPLVPGAAACSFMNPLPVNTASTCVAGPVTASGAPGSTTINTATASGSDGVTTLTTPPSSASYTLPPASADLSMVKTLVTAGPFSAGQSISYTLLVANAGPDTAATLQVTDAPTNLAITNVSGGGCSALPCAIASLAAGASVTINVTATIVAAGAFDNSATVTAVTADPVPGNNTDNTGNGGTAGASADVSMVKTLVTGGPFLNGQSISYTMLVANAGPSTATSIQVTDTPSNLTITNVTGGGCAALPCTIASLASGASATITVTATIAAAGAFDNSATATAIEPDPVPGNNTDNAGNGGTAGALVDLSVTKTDGVTSVTPGGSTTYIIVAFNAGPDAAVGATVADTFPATLTATWTCVGAGGGTCTAAGSGSINDTVNMPAGSTITYTVVANVSASATGNLVNTATVTAPSGVTDSNPGNNSATDADTLTPQADLSITKTDGVVTLLPGTATTYTIVVSNAGPSDTNGAIFTDAAVANLTVTGVTCGGASGGAACPTVPNTTVVLMQGAGIVVPALPSGGSVTFTVTATVPPGASGSITNVASITAPAGVTDPTPGNNSATDIDTITVSADLSITKTDGVVTVVPGTPTTYTIVVANSGPSNVTGATVADAMSAAIASDTFTATATGGATGFTASGSGNINDTVNMPAGSTITYTVVANISAGATGTVVNTATVTTPGGVIDSNPGNNSATDTDTLTPRADLSITKTDGVVSVAQGGTTTYTIVVANSGPSAVTGATVSDPMPAAIVSDTFTAVGSGGASGFTASGSGSINDTVNMPVGSTITYTVVANISASATGNLVNTATVLTPGGVTDTNPGNNSATDTDTIILTSLVDLGITKSDGSATYTPGNPVTYTMVVSNAGPAAATGATVSDVLPAVITGATWTCVGTGGGTCPASGAGNINASVNLPSGASVTFTLSGTVAPTATGNLVNTATVSAPSGTTDSNPSNNSATDTDTPAAAAGLAITKTDGSASYAPGGTGTYTITVTNNGPSNANSVTVTDNLPAGVTLTGPVTCVASGTATCGTITGSAGSTVFQTTGATIAVGAGNRIVFTLPVLFAAGMTTNPLTNMATATDPASVSVASASDTNVIAQGPTAPVPVDNRWALALLAGFILLAFRREARGAASRNRR